MRTVDGEILSEIAIHNFEKNRNSHSPLWKDNFADHVPRSTKTESLIETPLRLILKKIIVSNSLKLTINRLNAKYQYAMM